MPSGQTTTSMPRLWTIRTTGVLSVSALKVTADEVFNTLGVITSSGDLTANVGHLNNHNGEAFQRR